MRIWKCPECGKGKRAPERMQQDDVRQYCLECSAQTGKMVTRECPALERAAQKKAAKAAAKRERKLAADAARAARRAADLREAERKRWTVGDVDLREWWDKIDALKLFKLPRVPRVTRRYKRLRSSVSVRYGYNGHDVRLALGTSPAAAIAALIWGMACPYGSGPDHWDYIQTVCHALVDRNVDLLSKSKSLRYSSLRIAVGDYLERQRLTTSTSHDVERLQRLARLGDAEAKRQLLVHERRGSV